MKSEVFLALQEFQYLKHTEVATAMHILVKNNVRNDVQKQVLIIIILKSQFSRSLQSLPVEGSIKSLKWVRLTYGYYFCLEV